MPKRNANFERAPGAVVDAAARIGRNIAIARTRRLLREDDLAEKAGITRTTLRRVESGALGTGVGAYLAVLWALGLDADLSTIASPDGDLEGQTLEAARRGQRVRPDRSLSDAF